MATKTILSGARFRLGEYTDRVTIQAPVVPDAGDYLDVAANLWARVTPLSAWERLQAAQLQAAVQYRVAIPGCPRPLDTSMRLRWLTSPLETPVTLAIESVSRTAAETICDCVEAHA